MKEQTAVDFLIDKWSTQGTLYSSDISQAKEMENQQIIDAVTWGFNTSNGDKYYNETFNK